ncbi:MAG: methyltransferase domain-containing protein [Candidatus Paracaedibacter sp.]
MPHPLVFRKITTDSGTTHDQLSLSDSLAYIHTVFSDYKKYAGIDHFSGHVCELGPGDSSGVALTIMADGATRIDLADRFYSHRNASTHAQVYQTLANHNPQIAELLKTANLHDEATFPGITRYYGSQASGESFFKECSSTYVFIISRSVLEHATDPLLTLESMYQALNPGGYLIHKVDLRDHGMFTPHYHDLKFLEIPKGIYWAMTHDSGLPNRVLIDQYRQCISRLPGDCQLLITQLAYAGPVEPHVTFDKIPKKQLETAFAELTKHKNNFASAFRQVAEQDLIVAGFFLILKKLF